MSAETEQPSLPLPRECPSKRGRDGRVDPRGQRGCGDRRRVSRAQVRPERGDRRLPRRLQRLPRDRARRAGVPARHRPRPDARIRGRAAAGGVRFVRVGTARVAVPATRRHGRLLASVRRCAHRQRCPRGSDELPRGRSRGSFPAAFAQTLAALGGERARRPRQLRRRGRRLRVGAVAGLIVFVSLARLTRPRLAGVGTRAERSARRRDPVRRARALRLSRRQPKRRRRRRAAAAQARAGSGSAARAPGALRDRVARRIRARRGKPDEPDVRVSVRCDARRRDGIVALAHLVGAADAARPRRRRRLEPRHPRVVAQPDADRCGGGRLRARRRNMSCPSFWATRTQGASGRPRSPGRLPLAVDLRGGRVLGDFPAAVRARKAARAGPSRRAHARGRHSAVARHALAARATAVSCSRSRSRRSS